MTLDAHVARFRAAAKIQTPSSENSYRGLQIHARAGLHEFIGRVVEAHVGAGSTIVDLAAGSGAMSLRLKDLGYRVTAYDYIKENFRVCDQVDFCRVDLNLPFADRISRADAVVAVEIIEHLENTRHFFREVSGVLSPGGIAVVTTPNVGNPVSRAMFLRDGRQQWFLEKDYKAQGHITPVQPWVLLAAAQEAGLVCAKLTSYGDPFEALAEAPRMKWLSWIASRLMDKESERGEILVAVFRKEA